MSMQSNESHRTWLGDTPPIEVALYFMRVESFDTCQKMQMRDVKLIQVLIADDDDDSDDRRFVLMIHTLLKVLKWGSIK